ncbi:MAG: bifunctional 5,6,7,8-tetrahydromethanopterin hydro-lyase/3-hexulose-6-phosphate synthase [Methanobacteriota archaeon]|nr:MAG: bifunctional 5,6,7,8-tetrahydromethanopterin hydro-lyase/3-hexulose-6-phosphate synthase [Euryarchaeota archaeon]
MIDGGFAIGEALVGEEPEIAHIDLVVGRKDGPIGSAFASSLAQPRMGHTPILAVVRPNLPVKPATLIVPKVTIRDLEGAERIFGPAQSAVSKAVADAVDEGILPRESVEELAIIVSVFIHPRGKDYQRIYRYNYAATKLALKRAVEGFPGIDVVLEEKPKAAHEMIGFRINNLEQPPYLGVELVHDDWRRVEGILRALPRKDGIILKAGAPLIKRYGVEVCQKIHQIRPETVVIADMKSLDTGNLEARMAGDATADVAVFSGRAPLKTMERFIEEAHKVGALAYMDTINVEDPLEVINQLQMKPDIVELHATGEKSRIARIKEACGPRSLVAVAGEFEVDEAKRLRDAGADIIVLGETITEAGDINKTATDYLQGLGIYEVDQFRIMTDF